MCAGELVIRTAEIGDPPGLLALYHELNPTDPVMDRAHAEELFQAILAARVK